MKVEILAKDIPPRTPNLGIVTGMVDNVFFKKDASLWRLIVAKKDTVASVTDGSIRVENQVASNSQHQSAHGSGRIIDNCDPAEAQLAILKDQKINNPV